MKAVLSSLLCFVLLESQVFAIHGGPATASVTDITGTYAGVLIPQSSEVLFSNPAFTSNNDASNSLGIFLVSVPQNGATSGNFLIFDSGEAFAGTIIGITDPRTSEFKGVITGPDLANSGGTQFFSPVDAVGSINAFVGTAGSSGLVASLTGTAEIQEQGFAPDKSPDGVGFTTIKKVKYAVDGFQQSTSTTTVTIPTPSTTTIPGSSATP